MHETFFLTQGTKIFQYCTCPAGRKTYNFHSSCKHMHLSFKSVCNKEHKEVICNMTPSSNSAKSTRPKGRVLWEELLVLSRFHLQLRANECNFCPLLQHWRAVETKMSLCLCAFLQEPSLLTHKKFGCRWMLKTNKNYVEGCVTTPWCQKHLSVDI